jgi:hypothetical protein
VAGGQAGLNPELVDGQIDRLEECWQIEDTIGRLQQILQSTLFNPTTILHLEICPSANAGRFIRMQTTAHWHDLRCGCCQRDER